MPKKVCFLISVISLLLFSARLVAAQEKLVGLPAMEKLEKLPYFKYGERAKQVSSFDRSGGNNDGFSGTYSCLYRDSSGCVIFDEIGAGIVYQIWFTPLDIGNLKFYLDNETTPRLDIPAGRYFSGEQNPPYLKPLVGPENYSSGGFYSYVPFPFQKRLKIAVTVTPKFYHITYHFLNSEEGVTSFTGQEDYTKIRQIWSNIGQDPKSIIGNQTATKSATLNPGQTITLAEITGAGVINSLKIITPTTEPPSALTEGLTQSRLKIFWDGQENPAVNVPLGPLFGAYFTPNGIKSLMVGQVVSQYYLYFPMPFWSKAKIVLENRSIATLNFSSEIQYQMTTYGNNAGYFYATYHQEKPTTEGKDYPYLETSGTGHFVGTITFMDNPYAGNFAYLEGDERAYLDDSLTPALEGTGTEDYFNGGWYFKYGQFNLPSHGASLVSSPKITAYRLHLSDSLPFESRIKFGIEHGQTNNTKADYTNVAFYYKKDAPSLILSDEINVGDVASETIHNYQTSNQIVSETQTFFYEGDEDNVPITDDGRIFAYQGYSQFKTNISFNNQGVRLRRRTDFNLKGQLAKVYVDGVLAGLWYSAGNNSYKRWQDEIFEISPQFSQGKNQITVKIENINPAVDWNEYYYWVYSHIYPFDKFNLDHDPQGLINNADLTILLNRWETNEADLNDDGKTNEIDLTILLVNWLNNP